MPIGDFDYRILSYVSKAKNPTMETLCKKFGTKARPNIVSLCSNGYLFWEPSKASAFSRDDSGHITLSQKGVSEVNGIAERTRQTKIAVAKERLVGAGYTLILEAMIYLIHILLDKLNI